MLQKVTVQNPSESIDVLTLPLTAADILTAQYEITNIDGLGPVKAAVNTTPYGSIDGESYSGSSVGARNIVMTISTNPDFSAGETHGSLRRALYGYFMPKTLVNLALFDDDMETVGIQGFIESCEPAMFTNDPSLVVSVICPLPYFEGITLRTVTGLVQDEALSSTFTDIPYLGTVKSGFLLSVASTVAAPTYSGDIRVSNGDGSIGGNPQLFRVDGVAVDANDTLYFITKQGEKQVFDLTGTGDVISYFGQINDVTIPSDWVQLLPGTGINKFLVTGKHDGTNSAVGLAWTLKYNNYYGGL